MSFGFFGEEGDEEGEDDKDSKDITEEDAIECAEKFISMDTQLKIVQGLKDSRKLINRLMKESAENKMLLTKQQ